MELDEYVNYLVASAGAAKVKDDQVHGFLKLELKVPRGLWAFLENLQRVGGSDPKEYLEMVLSKELEGLLGNLPIDVFNLNRVRTRYGEGSGLNETPKAEK